jgi:gluconate/galactonate dehydratase
LPLWGELVEEPVIEHGRIDVPDRPGLGLTLDLDAVAEHLVDGETFLEAA